MTAIEFTTQTADGAAADADALPTAVLVVDGADTATGVAIVRKELGVYRAAFPRPAAYDTLQLRVAATVGGVAAKAVVWRETIEAWVRTKLGVGAPADPVIPAPGPPADAALGNVYAYLETPDNQPAVGVSLTFYLQRPATGVRSERLIAGSKVSAKTDAAGCFSLALQRNDLLTPTGTTWRVECKPLWDPPRTFSLTSPLLDLKTLVS